MVNVDLIDRILTLLTAVVTGAVLFETGIATFVLGTTFLLSKTGHTNEPIGVDI